MPIHDWTRVTAGTFHDFHGSWITHIKESLNCGLLPDGYFALQEQHAGGVVPDVLALTSPEWQPDGADRSPGDSQHSEAPIGALALADAPPDVSLRVGRTELETGRLRRRTISIRQEPENRIVAMIEVLSPGNKSSERNISDFVGKCLDAMRDGIHQLVVDLFPPTTTNPQGIHGAIWEDDEFTLPEDRKLTLVSYHAKLDLPEAFVEPISVGQRLPDMPVFLDLGWYVNVPLEATYELAWQGLPAPYRKILSLDD